MCAGIRSIVSGCSLSGTLLLEDNSSALAFGRHPCIVIVMVLESDLGFWNFASLKDIASLGGSFLIYCAQNSNG
ncbi:hypothetical protein PVK06_034944 [Gossypium arboreum]|uniref:Uncharacterized protein n=1 Tax=Gossypium arboreum TaxID=29729 RepID=A0ABR0NHT7_GOSAR|nr:hypothetical protein PVK06_034944 [Gossypium arboreum]